MTRQRAFTSDTLPTFEGRHVGGSTCRVAGPWPVEEMSDIGLGIGDVLEVLVTFRCVAVGHVVEKGDDALMRVHRLRPTTMTVAPPGTAGRGTATIRALTAPVEPAHARAEVGSDGW